MRLNAQSKFNVNASSVFIILVVVKTFEQGRVLVK